MIFPGKQAFVVDHPVRGYFRVCACSIHGPPYHAGAAFCSQISAAAYSSADSALTALTTSFCVDFLGFGKAGKEGQKKTRMLVHVGFAVLIFFVIIIFKAINNTAVISAVFTVAGYTYGPLLGLYTFGLFTKRRVNDKWV